MIKQILYAISSLLTLVGGHFLNRRFDRAVFFFMLFFLSVIGGYYFIFLLTIGADIETYLLNYQKAFQVMTYVWLAMLSLSALVTFMDAARTPGQHQTSWSMSGRVGAVLMTLMGFIGVLYIGAFFVSVDFDSGSVSFSESDSGSSFFSMHDQFHASANFGGKGYVPNAEDIPEGDGYLVGLIEYEGKPVPGIQLHLSVNDRYETSELNTDDEGRFEIRLPVGDWEINRVTTSNWKDKPEGEFLLASGYEPKYLGRSYSIYSADGKAKMVTVDSQMPDIPQLQLTIRKRVVLTKPGKQDKALAMSLARDELQWEPYPGAQQYLAVISSITRDGTSISSSTVASKLAKGVTRLSLNEFTTVNNEDGSNEYTLRVTAFDEEGKFLSQSERGIMTDSSFTLKENRTFVDDQFLPSTLGIPTQEQTEVFFRNRKKFNAIQLLISEKMYEPAKTLLDGIDSKNAKPGRKDAMQGYWYSSQGMCEQANKHFEQAREEGGNACISSSYYEGCQDGAK